MERITNSLKSINFKASSADKADTKPSTKPSTKTQTQTQHADEFKPVSVPTLVAYLNNFNSNAPKVEVKFNVPLSELEAKFKEQAKSQTLDLVGRAGKPGQVLNWIGELPKTQLSRLDEIYALADSMKKNNVQDGSGKIGIIGIGGSKHTVENLLTLNDKSGGRGCDKEKAVFLSAVDPDSLDKFLEKLGDFKNASIMVASKSGTTLEPSVGYEYVEKAFIEKFKKDYLKEGATPEEAQKKAEEETAKHFFCITDKDETKSKLGKVAKEKGYKCGVIHDDCGGRFGAFDDHSLTALAYCGMPKEDMKKMLESALKAQGKFLAPDTAKNAALQRAMFNAYCVSSGKSNQHDYYFSDAFEGTASWNTQMKKESHKSLYKVSGDLIGPAFLHNSTESDLDPGNKTSFYTFNTIKNAGTERFKAYNALVDGSVKAYSERHLFSKVELKDLSPESVGEFVEMKHFEAMYTGMLLRALQDDGAKAPEVLPEVEQPSVKIYKKEVEKILKA